MCPLRAIPITLRLEKSAIGERAKISYDAGDYVCNFSMYVILDYLRRHRQDARFGFVHVPHYYDLKRAAGFLRKLLKVLDASVVFPKSVE
jgi:pyrrolidone-carboxylate peptidase